MAKCQDCGGYTREGEELCRKCAAINGASIETRMCSVCGKNKCRQIDTESSKYVGKLAHNRQKYIMLCYECYQKEYNKNFFVSKKVLFANKADALIAGFLDKYNEANFYGNEEEAARYLRKYAIANDYKVSQNKELKVTVNPELWAEMGI